MSYLEGLREMADKERIKYASPEEARFYLEEVSLPVFLKEKDRQVLCANLLEDGKVGPSVTLRQGEPPIIIKHIGTDRGILPVPDETWAEGLEEITKTCGLD